MHDSIYIRALRVKTLIGILPQERLAKQTLTLSLQLFTDIRAAAASDDIGLTLNYARLVEYIEAFAAAARFGLLESFAEALAAAILRDFPSCESLILDIQKPRALPQTPQVGLCIRRSRSASSDRKE